MSDEKILGLVVNPIAGLGGRLGLKGTDSPESIAKARKEGLESISKERTIKFLVKLKEICKKKVKVITWRGLMGEYECLKANIKHYVALGELKEETTRLDTIEAVNRIVKEGIEILVFSGGDGTAIDVAEGLSELKTPVIGVPSGVKMYNEVFANDPVEAAHIVKKYLEEGGELRKVELFDVDEEDIRKGILKFKANGHLYIPFFPEYLSGMKIPTGVDEKELIEEIAEYLSEFIKKSRDLFIFGPGYTVKSILRKMGYSTPLFGVDVVVDGKLVGVDCSEKELLRIIHDLGRNREKYLVLSPIGGQGFILGRGNQQISSRVIREMGLNLNNMIVVATSGKLATLKKLKIDLDDESIKRELSGYIRVIIGRDREKVIKLG